MSKVVILVFHKRLSPQRPLLIVVWATAGVSILTATSSYCRLRLYSVFGVFTPLNLAGTVSRQAYMQTLFVWPNGGFYVCPSLSQIFSANLLIEYSLCPFAACMALAIHCRCHLKCCGTYVLDDCRVYHPLLWAFTLVYRPLFQKLRIFFSFFFRALRKDMQRALVWERPDSMWRCGSDRRVFRSGEFYPHNGTAIQVIGHSSQLSLTGKEDRAIWAKLVSIYLLLLVLDTWHTRQLVRSHNISYTQYLLDRHYIYHLSFDPKPRDWDYYLPLIRRLYPRPIWLMTQ